MKTIIIILAKSSESRFWDFGYYYLILSIKVSLFAQNQPKLPFVPIISLFASFRKLSSLPAARFRGTAPQDPRFSRRYVHLDSLAG